MVEATPSKAVRTRRAESIRAQIEFLSRPDVRLGGMGNPKTPTLDARDSCLFHGVRGKGKRGKRDWPRRGLVDCVSRKAHHSRLTMQIYGALLIEIAGTVEGVDFQGHASTPHPSYQRDSFSGYWPI